MSKRRRQFGGICFTRFAPEHYVGYCQVNQPAKSGIWSCGIIVAGLHYLPPPISTIAFPPRLSALPYGCTFGSRSVLVMSKS